MVLCQILPAPFVMCPVSFLDVLFEDREWTLTNRSPGTRTFGRRLLASPVCFTVSLPYWCLRTVAATLQPLWLFRCGIYNHTEFTPRACSPRDRRLRFHHQKRPAFKRQQRTQKVPSRDAAVGSLNRRWHCEYNSVDGLPLTILR